MAAIVMEIDVPPAEKNGRGKPVVGRIPTTTPMLRNACTLMLLVIPAASSVPNLSGQRTAIRIPRSISATNSATTIRQPSNPKSSPTMAKMKSLSGYGR